MGRGHEPNIRGHHGSSSYIPAFFKLGESRMLAVAEVVEELRAPCSVAVGTTSLRGAWIAKEP